MNRSRRADQFAFHSPGAALSRLLCDLRTSGHRPASYGQLHIFLLPVPPFLGGFRRAIGLFAARRFQKLRPRRGPPHLRVVGTELNSARARSTFVEPFPCCCETIVANIPSLPTRRRRAGRDLSGQWRQCSGPVRSDISCSPRSGSRSV